MKQHTSIQFNPGTRVYYTGDMANMSSFGTITAYHPRGQYTPESVDIKYDEIRFEGDDSRFSKMVPVIAFSKGVGQRFWFLDEWEQHRAEELEKLKSAMGWKSIPGNVLP